MSNFLPDQIQTLLRQGVIIPHPSSVYIAAEIDPARIAAGTAIHPGCRITGAQTSIGPNCVLGAEAPVTLANCQLGAQVTLQGGYFTEATFLDQAAMGSGAQVRPSTLIEEEAGGAHTVGLKQTILFPYAILGSLINFCDAFLSGGTSRKNHSEVGSSYIHFNYTPHQDKATPSLLGDVPRGVMLNQSPIFLGGQGGLAGPGRIAFGVIVPAGTIVRKDILTGGLYSPPPEARAAKSHYQPGAYQAVQRIVTNNLIYIGNILALQAWYRYVRPAFMQTDPFQAACLAGAQERLAEMLKERIKRLAELAEKMPRSLELAGMGQGAAAVKQTPYTQQQALIDRWPGIRERLDALSRAEGDIRQRDRFLQEMLQPAARAGYRETLAALSPAAKTAGTAWLQSIVDRAAGLWPPLA